MRWRWVCSNGHVTTVGVDLSVGEDRSAEAELEQREDGLLEVKDIREIKR